MRLQPTILAAALLAVCAPTATAQNKGKLSPAMRKEIQKIVRESVREAIRDAMRDLHGDRDAPKRAIAKQAPKKAQPKKVKPKKDSAFGVRTVKPLVWESKDGNRVIRISSGGNVVRGGDVATDVDVRAVIGNAEKALAEIKGLDKEHLIEIKKSIAAAKKALQGAKKASINFKGKTLKPGRQVIRRKNEKGEIEEVHIEVRAPKELQFGVGDGKNKKKSYRVEIKGDGAPRVLRLKGDGKGRVLRLRSGDGEARVFELEGDDVNKGVRVRKSGDNTFFLRRADGKVDVTKPKAKSESGGVWFSDGGKVERVKADGHGVFKVGGDGKVMILRGTDGKGEWKSLDAKRVEKIHEHLHQHGGKDVKTIVEVKTGGGDCCAECPANCCEGAKKAPAKAAISKTGAVKAGCCEGEAKAAPKAKALTLKKRINI